MFHWNVSLCYHKHQEWTDSHWKRVKLKVHIQRTTLSFIRRQKLPFFPCAVSSSSRASVSSYGTNYGAHLRCESGGCFKLGRIGWERFQCWWTEYETTPRHQDAARRALERRQGLHRVIMSFPLSKANADSVSLHRLLHTGHFDRQIDVIAKHAANCRTSP